jgi:hypothetical protein
MILNGTYGRWSSCRCRKTFVIDHSNKFCTSPLADSLEPGLSLLKQEYSAGKIIRLDEQTSERLAEFARPNETHPDLINRLLDIATQKTALTTAAAAENRI